MRRWVGVALVALGCSGINCASDRGVLRGMTSGATACSPSEIEIESEETFTGGTSWIATCRGVEYQCRTVFQRTSLYTSTAGAPSCTERGIQGAIDLTHLSPVRSSSSSASR